MKKEERANRVLVRLNELYPKPAIPLTHNNDFTFLVAVLLSAQCTDKKVNEVTVSLLLLVMNILLVQVFIIIIYIEMLFFERLKIFQPLSFQEKIQIQKNCGIGWIG